MRGSTGQGVKGMRYGRAARCQRSPRAKASIPTGASPLALVRGVSRQAAPPSMPGAFRNRLAAFHATRAPASNNATASAALAVRVCLLERKRFLRVGSTMRLSERRKGPPTPHRSLVSSRLPSRRCSSRLVMLMTLRPSVCQLGYVVSPLQHLLQPKSGSRHLRASFHSFSTASSRHCRFQHSLSPAVNRASGMIRRRYL